MKKQLKASLIMAGILSTVSIGSFAQGANAPVINAPSEIKQGNSFEKEITPLLREISRKKSQLELRKLDRELEKIDEESLKAQLDMENNKAGGSKGGGVGTGDPFAGKGTGPVPSGMPGGIPSPSVSEITSSVSSDIKVLMIYGFDTNLSAKIASGQQGGYVVKKGDIMPDGRMVAGITPNFIEIKKQNSKADKGIERIFVSSQGATSPSDKPEKATPSVGGSGSSANVPAQVLANPIPAQVLANNKAIATMFAPIPASAP